MGPSVLPAAGVARLSRWAFGFPELIRDSGAYLVSKAVPGLFGLVTVIAFVRLIGREEYGKYSLAMTGANLASLFFVGWLSQGLLRYYSEMQSAAGARRAVWLGLATATTAGVLTLGVTTGLTAELSMSEFAAMLVLFVTANGYQLRGTLLQAALRPREVALQSSAQAIIAFTVPVGLFLTVDRSYLSAVGGLAASYLVGAAWPAPWPGGATARQGRQGKDAARLLAQFWRYGWSLSLWFAATMMLQVSDRFFIERYFGFGATGSYAAVYDVIVRGYSLLLFPVTLAIHPRMMALWNGGEYGRCWAVWRWGVVAQAVPVAAVVTVLAALPPGAVGVILPTSGPETATLLMPLVIGGFLWQFALLAHKPLELAGRTGLMLASAIIALAINVTANAALLPRHGVQVTAYATVASGLAYVLMTLGLGALVHRAVPRAKG